MTRIMRAYEDVIVATLAEYGVTNHRFERGGKHTKCLFNVPGVGERFTVVPSSPRGAGNNGPKNQRNDLRKLFRSCNVEPLKKVKS
jgi:hypothetical protein